jgi:hypothetical protein
MARLPKPVSSVLQQKQNTPPPPLDETKLGPCATLVALLYPPPGASADKGLPSKPSIKRRSPHLLPLAVTRLPSQGPALRLQ